MVNEYATYISSLTEKESPLIQEMEQFAEENRIPIMDRSGIDTFVGLLRIQQPKFILEIGSAIGYSAIRMVSALKEVSIVTIERDKDRYENAVRYIARSGYGDRITIIEGDALLMDDEVIPEYHYDALFIDAAKGQYKRFFEKYSKHVAPGGVIYCDNMFMHGAVLIPDAELPKRNRTMIRNLKEFTTWIMGHPEYETSLLPVGDGILIAVKKRD
ncbi:O-methyltransferase [Sporosarcina highlanderae]|uniref:tRNA 5-hydroxyuridine methyltransferase n=1 Tax=Sporosarcina highlanderae TaxID=3035916 RepID=A0ABT8JPZ5_9BACL|nr:O-methyltransferase [Sporosarcina highlanderae]MDN4607092.1 O-methyltransferase [Sporosarcina highlanderae]